MHVCEPEISPAISGVFAVGLTRSSLPWISSVGAVIFEIARSEIDYTSQRPDEYICAVTAASTRSR